MSSIDNRIVSMKFNNAQFNAGIKDTNDHLDDLKGKLNFDGAVDALSRVGEAAKDLKLDGIASNVESVASKFSWLHVVGATALGKLTSTAMTAGAGLYRALVNPIVEGGKARALSMAQAKFQFKGLKMDVESTMASALKAVKGTAFGLDEAAVAAASFGASNVKSGKDMENALTGISGVAAMTGREYSDIARIFTTVAGNGRLMGDQLNQLGASGMNAAAAIAKSMKISESEVREMVSKGQISFKRFARIMNEEFGEHAKSSSELFTGALANMQVALKRIGAYYQTGKLERLRQVYNAMTPVIDAVANSFEPLIDVWSKMADIRNENTVKFLLGLSKHFDAFNLTGKNFAVAMRYIFEAISSITAPIKAAFEEVFPPMDKLGTHLVDFSRKIRVWAKSLGVGEEGAARIKWVFTGIFQAIKFGMSILGNAVRVIGSWVSALGQIAGAIFKLFGPVVDFLMGLFPAAADAEVGVGSLVDKLLALQQRGLKPLLDWLERVRVKFDEFLNGGKALEYITNGFERIKAAGTWIAGIWQKVVSWIKQAWAETEGFRNSIGDAFKSLSTGIKEAMSGVGGNEIMTALSTGVLAYLAYTIKGWIDNVAEIGNTFRNVMGSFGGVLDSVTAALGDMQKVLKAEALLKIAKAIALLAIALLLLSLVNPENLAVGIAGLAAVMGVLVVAMKMLDEEQTNIDTLKIIGIGIAIALFAGAMLLLSVALLIMSTIPIGKMLVGLLGMTVVMAALVGSMALLSKMNPEDSLIKAAFAMGLVAGAMLVLAGALWLFALIPLDKLWVGLVGFTVTLAAVTVALMFLAANSEGVMAAAGAISLISVSMLLLAGAIFAFGSMDVNTLATGLTVMVVILAALVGAILLLSVNNAATMAAAAAILALAIAVGMLVGAIFLLGSMSFETLIQGLFGIAVAMTMLVLTTSMMTTALPGAAATLIVAAALLILTIAVLAMAAIPMDALLKGLQGLVIVLALMAITALVMAPLSGILLALGGALALFGLGMIVIAASAIVFAIALAMLGPAMMAFVEGLKAFAAAAEELLQAAAVLAILGPALMFFGLGAAAAAIGVGALAVAFALFGIALLVISAALLALLLIGLPAMAVVTQMVTQLSALTQYAGNLALVGAVFILLGVGLAAFGVGAAAAGVGGLLLAVGLFAFSAAAEYGAMGLSVLAAAMLKFMPMIPAMMQVGAGIMLAGAMAVLGAAGFALLGAAMGLLAISVVVLGAGLVLVAVGLLLVSGGLRLFGAAASVGAMGVSILVMSVMRLIPLVGGIAALALAMAAMGLAAVGLGVAAGLAAAGIGILSLAVGLLALGMMTVGIGMMMTASGMVMIGASADAGAAGLKTMIGALAGLVFQIPMMATVGAAFLALGASSAAAALGILAAVAATLGLSVATLAAAAAMALLGASLGLVAMGNIAVASTSQMGAMGLMRLLVAVRQVMPIIPYAVRLSEALIKIGISAGTAGVGASGGAAGLSDLADSANDAATATKKMGDTTSATLPKAIDSINKMKPAMEKASKSMKSELRKMEDAISASIPKVVSSFDKLTEGIKTTVVSGVSSATMSASTSAHDVGVAISQGMARGMGNSSYIVSNAARLVAAVALSAARSELGVASPSKAFKKIGEFAVQGFAKGLRGDRSAVKAVYDTMRQDLKDLMASTKKDVQTYQDRLTRLNKAKNKDTKAITATKKALAQAKKEQKGATAAYNHHTKVLIKEERQLEKLADKRDVSNEKLKEETKSLEDAIKTRDDYAKSITDQYNKTKDVDRDTTFTNYSEDLQEQIEQTRKFATAIQELRARGIDDTMYKKLLSKGPDALPFIEDILNAGKAGVEELNYLSSELDGVTQGLGADTSRSLYQAGVDSARGIVAGLQKESDNISKEMDKIADKMVKSIKQKLGIKSPSRVFAKVGRQTTEGLAKGLSDSSKSVERAAENVGDTAISALSKTMSAIQDSMYLDMDMTPTIRPVLDLTDIRKDSGLLKGILGSPTLETERAYNSALASRPMRVDVNDELRETMAAILSRDAGTPMTYIQNNNSPKALSSAEIYRNTKNQLSVARKEG